MCTTCLICKDIPTIGKKGARKSKFNLNQLVNPGTLYEYMLIEIRGGIMQKDSAEVTGEVLAALGHTNRIRILEYLRTDVRCNCELAPALGLEQSNLSRHLKLLVQAGILISWKEGLRVNFKVADQRVYRILELAKAVAKRDMEKRVEALEEV